LRYRDRRTKEILRLIENANQGLDEDEEPTLPPDFVFDDIVCGADYLDLYQDHNMGENDTLVSFSLDGAKLYRNRDSDTWI
ncbi:hypothetical protein DFP72DRAFT_794812, partial [Ephemerocybe angulata]